MQNESIAEVHGCCVCKGRVLISFNICQVFSNSVRPDLAHITEQRLLIARFSPQRRLVSYFQGLLIHSVAFPYSSSSVPVHYPTGLSTWT